MRPFDPVAARAPRAHGPGDLTITAVVLFALGTYGVAAGSVTGEERAVAVGVFAFTLFAVGVVWPIITLAHVKISVSAPADATVGDEVPLRIRIDGRASRVEVRVLDPVGQWWTTGVPTDGVLPHRAVRRGVFPYVRVQLRTAAPLGVFLRTRQARVQLRTPVAVAPRPLAAGAMSEPIPPRFDVSTERSAAGPGGDVVRAVRPYVPGDPARLVHWPTSARRGGLAVREHDPVGAEGVALVVDLTGPAVAADAAAGRAAGIGRSVLARGGRVLLCTCETFGPRAEEVSDARELGRRLAYAVGGAPAEPPAAWPAHWVRAVDQVTAP
jgi:uncharacterized protein (DUF58 family)